MKRCEELLMDEKYDKCERCFKPFHQCDCCCPFCGERDSCECALFDAATGGG